MQEKLRTSISLGVLRVLATLFVVQLLTQVVLAAAFVTGETDLFSAHSINGSLMNTLPLAMLVTALVHATLARGARWPIAAVAAVLVLCMVQEVLGYVRVVGAHIVGGTLLLSAGIGLCVALWRLRYAPRPRRGEPEPVLSPAPGLAPPTPTPVPNPGPDALSTGAPR